MGSNGVKCLSCQFENREEVKFCEECGGRMKLECPSCRAKVPPGRKFCGECGHSLTYPSRGNFKVLSKEECWKTSVADFQARGLKRRKSPRRRADFCVFYGERNNIAEAKAVVRDVSPEGLRLMVHNVLPPGSRIILELRKGNQRYYACGEVKWCRRVVLLEKSDQEHSLIGVGLNYKSDGFSKLLIEFWQNEGERIKALLEKRKSDPGERALGV